MDYGQTFVGKAVEKWTDHWISIVSFEGENARKSIFNAQPACPR